MNRLNCLPLAWLFLLAVGLSGCGNPIKIAEYPSTWPSRVTNSARLDCLDISGRYMASNGEHPLPFFLFGIPDTDSLDWANLVQINEQILAEPVGATVTIGFPDSDHIEVVVAMRGTPIAKQVLTRSRQSTTASVWFGQDEKSFRCEPDGIVVVGAYIHDWSEYRLPFAEKKRRYRRPGKNDVGTSRGYFRFSRATDGSLVMRQGIFFCLGCGGLDELWRRWEPAPVPDATAR
jgi:hypothetical protein